VPLYLKLSPPLYLIENLCKSLHVGVLISLAQNAKGMRKMRRALADCFYEMSIDESLAPVKRMACDRLGLFFDFLSGRRVTLEEMRLF